MGSNDGVTSIRRENEMLNKSAIRAIAIRRNTTKAANDVSGHDNDNGPSGGSPAGAMRISGMLAACIAASGFEQHAAR